MRTKKNSKNFITNLNNIHLFIIALIAALILIILDIYFPSQDTRTHDLVYNYIFQNYPVENGYIQRVSAFAPLFVIICTCVIFLLLKLTQFNIKVGRVLIIIYLYIFWIYATLKIQYSCPTERENYILNSINNTSEQLSLYNQSSKSQYICTMQPGDLTIQQSENCKLLGEQSLHKRVVVTLDDKMNTRSYVNICISNFNSVVTLFSSDDISSASCNYKCSLH